MDIFKIICLVLLSSCSSSHWDYAGEADSYHWGELRSDFKKCEVGETQSPINLTTKKALPMVHPISFNYHDMRGKIVNNGHTIEVDFEKDIYVELEKTKYFLEQFHFHAKSEHSLEGLFYPAELHLVHRSAQGELLVLGYFIEVDDENYDHYGFFKKIPARGKSEMSEIIQLEKLSQLNGKHFYYKGSLTVPPCTENVNWVIFDKHLKLSSEQIDLFAHYYSNNYRPIQKNKGHKLYLSE
jgi:carbonic anhydrase